MQRTKTFVVSNMHRFPEVQRTETFATKKTRAYNANLISKEKMPKGCGGLSDVLYVCMRQRRLCKQTIRNSEEDRTNVAKRKIV